MARKQAITDTFEGKINPGDLVRFFLDGGNVLDLRIRYPHAIDADGDARIADDQDWPDYHMPLYRVTHIKVLEAAPPVATAQFGQMRLAYNGGSLIVNGEHVNPGVVYAIGVLCGYWDVDADSAAEMLTEWRNVQTGRACRITSETFSLGCASCSMQELHQALDWYDALD